MTPRAYIGSRGGPDLSPGNSSSGSDEFWSEQFAIHRKEAHGIFTGAGLHIFPHSFDPVFLSQRGRSGSLLRTSLYEFRRGASAI
jgi:hypothetical protein